MLDEVVQKDEVVGTSGRRQLNKAGESARHGDDSKHGPSGTLALAPEQKRDAQGFVQYTGKWMGGVDGDWREQGIDFALVVSGRSLAGRVVHVIPAQHAHSSGTESGQELLVPALVLLGDEAVHGGVYDGQGLLEGRAVGVEFGVAVFDTLQHAGYADLDKFVQIAGGDGQKLNALEEGIGFVLSFFEHTAVEIEPGFVSAEEEALLRALRSGHKLQGRCLSPKVYINCYT